MLIKFFRLTLAILSLVIVIALSAYTWFVLWPTQSVPELESVDAYRYLDQGWIDQDRQTYYYTGQGTSMTQGASINALRYSWFVNLERPFSTERFADPDHLRRWRFIVEPEATKDNPDQLPLGFGKHFNREAGEYLLDISCAACHSGELHVRTEGKTTALRVDGGQAMHALTDLTRGSFSGELLAAMIDTVYNPFKFNRFADRVLKEQVHSDASRKLLKENLSNTLMALLESGQNNPLRHLYPVQEGYGRTDALGRIGNTVFGDHLVAKNYQVGAAPVSFPPVWNIWKFDWVQYNGSVAQPLARNIGEAMGVGAILRLRNSVGEPLPKEQRFDSSVLIHNLQKIERTLQTLRPPQWPSDLLGEPNAQLALEGKDIFDDHCQKCHGPHRASVARTQSAAPLKTGMDDQWLIKVLPVKRIGTDATAATGFMERRYDLSSTGITNDDIAEILKPLFLRQWLRDMQWHLKELVSSGDADALADILSAYPDPDETREVKVPTDYLSQLTKQFIKHYSALNIPKSAPYVGIDCDLNCHRQSLAWQLKFGLESIAKALAELDVKQLTEGEALNLIGLLIKEKYYRDNNISYQDQMCIEGFGTLDLPQQVAGYKPRPLEGIWATPPFLHNGSILNIKQLLSDPAERTGEFVLGSRLYNPKTLGFEIQAPGSVDGFVFDTQIAGNSNRGHEFSASAQQWLDYKNGKLKALPSGVIGPQLSNQQVQAVLEYLKVHKDNLDGSVDYIPPECGLQ